jgi:hypothetical protein
MFLHNLLNVLIQIANRMGLQKKKWGHQVNLVGTAPFSYQLKGTFYMDQQTRKNKVQIIVFFDEQAVGFARKATG